MITSLNPKVSGIITIAALVAVEAEASANNAAFISFIIGALITLPLISEVWHTMRKNWPLYRKFYSMGFGNRDLGTVKKSWKLTWWIIPYAVVVFSLADALVLLHPELGTATSMLWGVVATTFGYTFCVSPGYYENLRKKKARH
jgi:hypothetical protein